MLYRHSTLMRRRIQATFFLAYLAFLGVAWYSIGIGYLFGAMLGPLQVEV